MAISSELVLDGSPSLQKRLAVKDFFLGLKNIRMAWLLAYQDILLRYRRSTLGPLWITLSMAITVYTMGFLYSQLFHIELQNYFPYLVAGMLVWTLTSTTILELNEAFIVSEGLIKQIKLAYSLYILRVIFRNILIFILCSWFLAYLFLLSIVFFGECYSQ